MVLAATRPTLHPRTGIYQFRKAVPGRLRDLVGKREVKVSLGTRDPAAARRLHAAVAAQVDADWAARERAAFRGDAPPVRLDDARIAAIAARLHDELLARHWGDPGERAYWIDRLERAQPALPPDLRTSSVVRGPAGWAGGRSVSAARLVGGRIEELLESEGLDVDVESRNRLNLAGAVAAARAWRELAARAGCDTERRTEPPPLLPVVGGKKISVPWRQVHEAYRKEMKPAASTVKRQTGVLEGFFAFLGHDDMTKVTKADAERWIEHRLEKVAPRTVRDADMAHPKTLFIWARRKNRITHRPFDDIKVVVPDGEQLRDREFDQDEAERILSATLLPCGSRMSPEHAAARRWVPWIACYSGARVNEITQARAEDVVLRKSRNGREIWCIRLTPEAGSIKNGKARWVALHPHLVEQGFPEYAMSRTGRYLFYDPGRGRGASGTEVGRF